MVHYSFSHKINSSYNSITDYSLLIKVNRHLHEGVDYMPLFLSGTRDLSKSIEIQNTPAHARHSHLLEGYHAFIYKNQLTCGNEHLLVCY